MKSQTVFAPVLLALVLGIQAAASGQASHPYILVKSDDLPGLRTKIQSGVPNTAYDSFRNNWYTASFSDGLGTALWGAYGEELALRWLLDPSNKETQGQNAVAILMDAVDHDEQAEWNSGTWIVGFSHGVAALGILYDLLYDRLSASQRAAAVADIERCCLLLWNSTEVSQGAGRPLANYPISAYAGLGLAALAIRWDSTHSLRATWLDTARDRIRDHTLRDAWDPDGSYEEDVMYMFYGSPNAVRFSLGLKNATGTDILAGSNMDRCIRWLTYQWVPGNQFVPHGDAGRWDGKEFAAEFLATARGDDRALARWLWDQVHPGAVGNLSTNFCLSKKAGVVLWYPSDVSEMTPAAAGLPLGAVFRDNWNPGGTAGLTGQDPGKAGLIHMKSAWGNDAFAFTLMARDEYTYHAHNDGQTVTVDAYGERFLEDRPVRDYSETARGSTDEHSILQADSVNNLATYRYGYRGEIGAVFFGGFADYARTDGRYSLGRFVRDFANMENSVYYPWERGDRMCAFVRGDGSFPYVWMADDVKKDGDAHAYHSQLHTFKTNVTGTGNAASPFVINGTSAEMHCAFLSPSGLSTSATDRTFSSGTHKVILGSATGVNHLYLVFMYPRKKDGSMPMPDLEGQTASAGAAAGKASWPGGTDDHVLVGPGGSTVSGTALQLSGDMRLALVRRLDAEMTCFTIGEGSMLSAGAVLLFDSKGVPCCVESAAGSACVNGDGIGFLRVLAPGAAQSGALRINGAAHEYHLDGDYIVVGPKASLAADPQSGTAPLTVAFDASASTAMADGAWITLYEWDFGDGSTDTSTDPTTSHDYIAAGDYQATLTIRTNIGESSACSIEIEVSEPEPEPVTPPALPAGSGCQCSPSTGAGTAPWAGALIEATLLMCLLALLRRRPGRAR